MPHFAASDLVLHYVPLSHKKDARLIWVNDLQVTTLRYTLQKATTTMAKKFNLCIIFLCRLLQKSRLKHMNSIVMRDGLRNEVAKQQRIEEEMHEEREQQKMDIAKLNTMINQSEEQMTKLRNRYEKAITHRNER